MISRVASLMLICLSCVPAPSSSTASRPSIQSCEVAVAQGAVHFTVQYASPRALPETLLVVTFVRPSRGEDVLTVHVRKAERTIIVNASGESLRSAEGWVETRTGQAGTIQFAIPEIAADRYDLSGLKARAHVVVQIERGEGAIGLGEVDSKESVF